MAILTLAILFDKLPHGTLGRSAYVQIVLSALLVAAILLQRTGASLGGAFGADNFSSGFHTRRVWRGTSSMHNSSCGVVRPLGSN